MRRSTPILICCALILLLGVAEAIASSGVGISPAPPPFVPKITGPTVKGTILIGCSRSDAPDTFAIRLTKGDLSSGAIVVSSRVQKSLFNTTSGNIAFHFLGGETAPGGLLKPYFFGPAHPDDPDDPGPDNTAVLIEIFHELGIAISLDPDAPYEPVIVAVDDAVCSQPPPPPPVGSNCTGTLSLDVKIKFAFPKKR